MVGLADFDGCGMAAACTPCERAIQSKASVTDASSSPWMPPSSSTLKRGLPLAGTTSFDHSGTPCTERPSPATRPEARQAGTSMPGTWGARRAHHWPRSVDVAGATGADAAAAAEAAGARRAAAGGLPCTLASTGARPSASRAAAPGRAQRRRRAEEAAASRSGWPRNALITLFAHLSNPPV